MIVLSSSPRPLKRRVERADRFVHGPQRLQDVERLLEVGIPFGIVLPDAVEGLLVLLPGRLSGVVLHAVAVGRQRQRLVGVASLVARSRLERHVDSLVPQTHGKRFRAVALLREPAAGVVGQQVRDVTLGPKLAAVVVEHGVEVVSLAAESEPVVESRADLLLAPELRVVHLADEGRLVSPLLQQLRIGGIDVPQRIDAHVVLRDAVQMRVDARQEAGPRRRTERHRAEEVGEGHPFALEPRDVRRLEKRIAAAAPDGVVGQVVEQDEEHVGPFGRLGCLCASGEKPRRTGTDDQWQMRSHGLSLFGRLLAGCVQ